MVKEPPTSSDVSAAEQVEFALEIPSDPRTIESAVAQLVLRLRNHAFHGSRVDLNFRVGVTEALANAMIYGNGRDPRKRVRVEVTLDQVLVSLRVIDQGKGFDPEAVPDPTLPSNLERAGGRGIFLIRKLMDEVRFNSTGNEVQMVLRRVPDHQRRSDRR